MTKPALMWKTGDTVAKPFTIVDGNGEGLDLTDATGRFLMRLRGGTTNKITNGSGLIVTNATTGQCEYRWESADVDTAGVYNAEIEFTFVGGRKITSETFIINIIDDLD